MITVTLAMKLDHAPLKRTPVSVCLDADGSCHGPVLTDREGRARFDLPPASGKVLVDGVERLHGHLAAEVQVELWSPTWAEDDSIGAPGGLATGNPALPGTETLTLLADGRAVPTDAEGYLQRPDDWSEAFVRARAAAEGLALADAHWEVIRYLRAHFARTGTQASVRDMVRHFSRLWGADAGASSALHRLFPRGGPQKQGNRLAGLPRVKGEH
jgi:tRNA 2-thiouridine synthesizing protein E